MPKQTILQIMSDIRNLLLLQKDLFTIEEVCSYTGYEKSYIYKLCSAKVIKHYKPGGKKLFFDKKEIIEWLKSNPVMTQQDMAKQAQIIRQVNKL